MQPVGNSYLVKRITTKPKNNDLMGSMASTPTPGSLSPRPEKVEESKAMKGEVMGIPKLIDKGDEHVCKKGDKIMFRYGNPIEVDGEEYLLVNKWDISLIL